jgi:hypothetical protein
LFSKSEALWVVKVLESLSWVFVSEVFVLEDINFIPKTLFHSPNFGEGIDQEAD